MVEVRRCRSSSMFQLEILTVITFQFKRQYFCSKCGNTFNVEADIESSNMYPKPIICEASQDCPGREFTLQELDPNEQDHRDYQEIKVQEQLHQIHVGAMPRSVHVILMEDLVDLCKAGDDVTINGIVSRRWRQFGPDERCDLEMIIVANHLKVNNEHKMGIGMTEELKVEFENFWKQHADKPLVGRDYILKSICPDIFGMFIVKLSVGLVVAGGVARRTRDGTKIRGESHLLLVGDPGTGKSQVLKFASKMATRSVVTTGIGTTGAGLTVTAVKDKGGDWVLEAGALVLADGGICCIDEFSSMHEHDRTTIHEAMEQQTLSIAKAGLVCKLQTRCSVLGATNTKGNYNPSEPLSSNVNVAGPLLSRFDLVIVMVDGQDRQWDGRLADFILENRQKTAALIAQQQQEQNLRREKEGFQRGERRSVWQQQLLTSTEEKPESLIQLEFWTMDKLQAYFSYIRATFTPMLTDEAQEVLTRYYSKQRVTDNIDKSRTTIRMLEALIRLAEAHAKIMFRSEVLLIDAIMAVYAMEASMSASASILKSPPSVQSLFQADPDLFFEDIQGQILIALGLEHLEQRRPAPGSGGSGIDYGSPVPFDRRSTGGSFGGRREPMGSNQRSETDEGPSVVATEDWGRPSEHSQYSQLKREQRPAQHQQQPFAPPPPRAPTQAGAGRAPPPLNLSPPSSNSSGDIPPTPSPSLIRKPPANTQSQAPGHPAPDAPVNQVFSPPWKRNAPKFPVSPPMPAAAAPRSFGNAPQSASSFRQPFIRSTPDEIASNVGASYEHQPPTEEYQDECDSKEKIVEEVAQELGAAAPNAPEPSVTQSVATEDLLGNVDWGLDDLG